MSALLENFFSSFLAKKKYFTFPQVFDQNFIFKLSMFHLNQSKLSLRWMWCSYNVGGAENDGHENDRPSKCPGMKLSLIDGHENDGHEIDLHENDGHEIDLHENVGHASGVWIGPTTLNTVECTVLFQRHLIGPISWYSYTW